jgi:hypothetical protein
MGTSSDFKVDVLIAEALLVDALVMECLALVLVMTGLLEKPKGPGGAPCGRVGGL